MAAEAVEDVLDSLSNTGGVIGVVVCDHNGIPARDTFQELDRGLAINYAQAAASIAREALPLVAKDGGLSSIRVRTQTVELFIKANERYLLVVVQDPSV